MAAGNLGDGRRDVGVEGEWLKEGDDGGKGSLWIRDRRGCSLNLVQVKLLRPVIIAVRSKGLSGIESLFLSLS